MGTEVLRSQDIWADRTFRLSSPPAAVFHRRKNYYPNTRHYRKPSVPRVQRRKSPSPSSSPSPPFLSPSLSSSPSPPFLSPSPSPPLTPQPQQKREHIFPPPAPLPIPIPRRSPSLDELQAHYSNNHNKFGDPAQMGRVRILRRGQSLDTIDATRMKRDMNSIDRGGLIKKTYLDEDDVYAGSAFFASPSPSSLPLPSFFNNNNNNSNSQKKFINTTITIGNDEIHDSATRDLRRLLRLD